MHQSCEQQPNPIFCEEKESAYATICVCHDDEEAERKKQSMTVQGEAWLARTPKSVSHHQKHKNKLRLLTSS
jgi:hypothetical protein